MKELGRLLTIAPGRPRTCFACLEHDDLGRIRGIVGVQKMV